VVSATDIREQLVRLLRAEISVQQFEDWLVPATWDAHKSSDREAEDLADEVELNLSEYSGGDLSRAELVGRLSALVFPFVNRAGDPFSLPVAASNAKPKVGGAATLVPNGQPVADPISLSFAA